MYHSISGEGEWIHGGPWASNIGWMSFNPHDTTQVYAIQNDGGYWISEDCGRTWDIHVTNLPVSIVYYLLFHPTSPDTMFMLGKVGYNRVPFRSVDGGNSWNQFDQGLNEVDVRMLTISSLPPYRLYAGENAREDPLRLFRCDLNDDAWEQIATFPTYFPGINEVREIEEDPFIENRLLVVANWGLWESLDNGETWLRLLEDNGYDFLDIEFDPEIPHHVIAYSLWLGIEKGIYRSTDGGYHWKAIPGVVGLPVTGFIVSDFYVDYQWNLYCQISFNVYKSTDHGYTWNQIAVNFPTRRLPEFEMYNLQYAVNPCNTSTLLLANRNGLFYSIDGGINYEFTGKGLGYSKIIQILPFPESPDQLHVLTEHIGHWSYNPMELQCDNLMPFYLSVIKMSENNPNPLYLAGFTVFRSYDQGVTVMPIHYLIYEMLRDMSVHPINSRSVYILTGSVGLKYSDDFGDSWARIIYPGNIHPQATCFDPEHPDDFYLAGDRIYRSNDLGENWVSISDLLTLSDFILQPLSEGLYGLTSSSPQQIVYLPSANEIFQDITGDLPEVEYRQILLQPGSLEHLFLATEEGVYHTLDYGESWSLLEGPYDHDVSAIAFSEDGTDIYIGTMAQGIWTGIDIDFNNIPEQQFSSIQPASVTLFPAYPNPFNSGTYIRFDLSYTSEIEVKIFDITGRFVQTLTRGIYTSGEYQLYWNGLNSIGGHIASGCYVIKLSNDVESNQHRVILTR